MQRYDDRIRRGAGGGNERKEVCCRNCTHVSNFPSSSSFEQGKKVERVVIPSKVEESRGGTHEYFHGIFRLRFAALRMTPGENPCLRFLESLVRPET